MWLVYSRGGEIPTYHGVFETEADAKTVAGQVGGEYDPVKRYRAGDTSLHYEYLCSASAVAVPAMRVVCQFGGYDGVLVALRDSEGDLDEERTSVGVDRCERDEKTLFVHAHAETVEEAQRLVMAKIREVVGPEVDSWEVRNV
jgi:hypothetical protein